MPDQVSNLCEHDVVDEAMRLALVQLVSSADRRIMAAYSLYKRSNDSNSLIDRVISLASEAVSAAAKTPVTSRKKILEMDDQVSYCMSRAVCRCISGPVWRRTNSLCGFLVKPYKVDGHPLTSLALLQLAIIDLLYKANQLTDEKKRFLDALVQRREPLVMGIFERYEKSRDATRLLEDFKGVDVDDLRADDDDEDDDVQEEDVGVDSRFMHIMQNMQLSGVYHPF